MSAPRKYDHDEAYARWQAGESQSALARFYGVPSSTIHKMITLRDPERRAAFLAKKNLWQRERYRQPCIRGCGRLAWHHMWSGVCDECSHTERHAAALARDNHGTVYRYGSLKCRCQDCRDANAAASRQRRRRVKERAAMLV